MATEFKVLAVNVEGEMSCLFRADRKLTVIPMIRIASARFWPRASGYLENKRKTSSLRIPAGHVVQAIISATDPQRLFDIDSYELNAVLWGQIRRAI